jgi:hypothetical protein
MSWQPSNDPEPGDRRACDAIEQVIVPRARDLALGRRAAGSGSRYRPLIFF